MSQHKYKLVRLTTGVDIPPTVSRVVDGTDKVFWGPGQPMLLENPPGYEIPVDWPKQFSLFRTPQVVRLFIIGEDVGEPSGDECRAIEVFFEGSEGTPDLDYTYCDCDASTLIDVEYIDTETEEIKTAHLEAATITRTILNGLGNSFWVGERQETDLGSCQDNDLGHDEEDPTDPGAVERREDWQNVSSDDVIYDPNDLPVDFQSVTVVDGNPEAWLAWAAVDAGYTSSSQTDRLFFPGKPLIMIVPVDKRLNTAYGSDWESTDEVQRIKDQFKVFPSIEIWLINEGGFGPGNDPGEPDYDSPSFETIADTLRNYGVKTRGVVEDSDSPDDAPTTPKQLMQYLTKRFFARN